MKNICDHCEYGNRFIDLGECPECATGRIVGDLHTRNIFCSNLHKITALAVDFCGQKNCEMQDVFSNTYQMIITSEIPLEMIHKIGKQFDQTPVQILKSIKNHTSFTGDMDFYKMIKTGNILYKYHIPFKVVPDVPFMSRFPECFPDLRDDYGWVFRINQ